ncbi:uncharacterized protein KGF55_001928 [Candida pseudojiufengensis]|uniref:uncharacterized protein n=1 Tax=Candida pseudojiufengensis TaxID=497109 RepID=UPI002225187E|nr:uncharacterized protein KGF55_001928 [Candida pseudojiufengensis]KAI5964857.1 hypothetical protein KGF55_001928 [Candida pseudojiufengensis]
MPINLDHHNHNHNQQQHSPILHHQYSPHHHNVHPQLPPISQLPHQFPHPHQIPNHQHSHSHPHHHHQQNSSISSLNSISSIKQSPQMSPNFSTFSVNSSIQTTPQEQHFPISTNQNHLNSPMSTTSTSQFQQQQPPQPPQQQHNYYHNSMQSSNNGTSLPTIQQQAQQQQPNPQVLNLKKEIIDEDKDNSSTSQDISLSSAISSPPTTVNNSNTPLTSSSQSIQHKPHSNSNSTPQSQTPINQIQHHEILPKLSREFVVRRISEGETGRVKEDIRCEACGKGYKHISSLAKHLWEHTPEWNVTKKLLISKHQQVQLLEAASILIGMNETTSSKNNNGDVLMDSSPDSIDSHSPNSLNSEDMVNVVINSITKDDEKNHKRATSV